jgi:hypothetical protein
MVSQLRRKLLLYQITAIFSVIFALAGFSYNVWRMEASETNNNIRTACFEMLTELAALEQLVFTAVYDKDLKEGSPRKGWVKVGLLNDLSALVSGGVELKAQRLKSVWAEDWSSMIEDPKATQRIIDAADAVRMEIKSVLASLD